MTEQPKVPFFGMTCPDDVSVEEYQERYHRLAAEIDTDSLQTLRKTGDAKAEEALNALLENEVPVFTLMHLDVGHKSEKMTKFGFVTAAPTNITSESKHTETLAEVTKRLASSDPRIEAIVQDVERRPDWISDDEILRAKQLFQRNWYCALMVYGLRCLLLAYMMPRGMEVLSNYGSSLKCPNDFQRLFHTAFFVLVLMELDDEHDRNSDVFNIILHVRLMHSAIRKALLKRRSSKWDVETLGVPINQEDMIGTIMLFSVICLEGMKLLGPNISEEDSIAYVKFWAWTGIRLGCDERSMPKDMESSIVLGYRLAQRSYGVNENVQRFIAALVSQSKEVVPFTEGFMSAAVYHMVGPKVGKDTGLPAPSSFSVFVLRVVIWVFYLVDLVQRRFPIVFRLLMLLKRPLMNFAMLKARFAVTKLTAKHRTDDGEPAQCPFH